MNSVCDPKPVLPASQLLGRPLEFLPLSAREAMEQTFAKGVSVEREITLPAANGVELTLHLSASMIERATGGGEVVVLLSDLTAAKHLERHMRQLDCLASIG